MTNKVIINSGNIFENYDFGNGSLLIICLVIFEGCLHGMILLSSWQAYVVRPINYYLSAYNVLRLTWHTILGYLIYIFSWIYYWYHFLRTISSKGDTLTLTVRLPSNHVLLHIRKNTTGGEYKNKIPFGS